MQIGLASDVVEMAAVDVDEREAALQRGALPELGRVALEYFRQPPLKGQERLLERLAAEGPELEEKD